MKHLSFILPLVALAVFLPAPSSAAADDSGRIVGKVQDKGGEALFGAVVSLFRYDKEGASLSLTRSDAHGIFALKNIAPGSYSLRVTRPGYQPVTKAGIVIGSGKTTSLDLVLQGIFDLISADADPRNWDVKTVMRSTSDRRLIFRDLEAAPRVGDLQRNHQFSRGAVLNVASTAGLSGDNYSVYPSRGGNGIVSNFAYSEPVGERSQMIFAGQLTSGYDSFWRVRNSFHFRPEPGRDLEFSAGYGRLNPNRLNMSSVSVPSDFFSQDPSLRESGVETVTVGFGAGDRLLDTVAVEYGFDLSHIYYGTAQNVFSPYFKVVIQPAAHWIVKSMMVSKRASENSTVMLPDGEAVNLLEPTYIAKIDGRIRVSQFKHHELSIERELPRDTSVEVALYEDHMVGPGTPFLVTMRSLQSAPRTQVVQLDEEQTAQHGMRIVVGHRFSGNVSGSVTYVYGTGSNVLCPDEAISTGFLAANLLDFVHRSYYNSVTSQLDARIPLTGTKVAAVLRWYPGSTITPIDFFSDRMDTLTKGVTFCFRQAIPLPEFMGSAGRWEALVDVRNLFDQGSDWIPTSDGEVLLSRNPRSLRFGLNLNLN